MNACLAIVNCSLCLSSTSLARKMIVEDFQICPNGYRGCDKEKLYFGTFYFMLYMSAIFGCIISLFFKSVNRRKYMMTIHCMYIIGSILTIYSKAHIILFLFSQAFFGISIGCSIVIVSLYILEYTPKEYQQYYGYSVQTFFSIGLLISYIFGSFYENIWFKNENVTYWTLIILYKIHLCLPLLFSVISLVLLYFVFTMDTPLHLYESQKYDKFEKIKKKISIKEFNEKEEYHKNITTNEISLLGNDINIIDFFKNTKLRKACFTCSLLCYLYSFNGCFLFFNKLFLFYKAFTNNMTNTFTAMGFIFFYFICTIITTILSQKYNKKDLLIIGLILQGISATGIVGSYFLNFSNVLNQIVLTVAIAFYFLGLSLGFGHIIWTHIFEMFPKECKVVGAFCSYYALFIGAFIMSILLEYVSMQYYSYLFITFLVSLIASVLCSGLFCQEDVVAIKRHDSVAPSDELAP
ncbi:sugar transporter, putative [Plasmodium ovale wallikeri]|uniref:Sugar transporter, putative n=2 Tax=Plasmodium ovale TaxID=36330 RepID=A0A1A8YPF7_PLAOA|nr:sugar transporter, putative [Plasmodium ovale wallikeri]SBT33935.1 sugar transporter, putative [Plasmodium ovale wallikeri]SBT76388.1 major facilitator superfamily domain-containing protein, putative [Plasmodium ovale]